MVINQKTAIKMTTSAAFGQLRQPSARKWRGGVTPVSAGKVFFWGEAVHSDCQIEWKSKQCTLGWSKCQRGPARLRRFLPWSNASCWSEGVRRTNKPSGWRLGIRWKGLTRSWVILLFCHANDTEFVPSFHRIILMIMLLALVPTQELLLWFKPHATSR